MLVLNRRYTPLVIAAIVAAGCWVLSLSTPAGAQSGAWSAPTSLGEYWFPDVAVDASGRVHAVWASGTTGFDAVMYAKRELGGEWSRPIDIFAEPQIAGGSEATRPTLFVDSDNQLHSTHRSTTVFYSQAPAGGAHVASYWRAQLAIGEGYFSRVARSADGALHLIYTQNLQTESCRICYHVYYVRSYDDGISWSDPQDISLELIGTAKPQLLIDSQQNLHVVWESGLGGSYGQLSDPTTVVYVGSADGGESWSLPYKFDPSRGVTTAAMARNIAIGEDGNGHLVVAWWAIPEDTIYFQTSRDAGRTWSMAQPIPNVLGIWALYQSRLDDYAMATDSAGRVHLVLVGRRAVEQTQAELIRITWDGSGWSQPDVIAAYGGDMPEWPRIAVGLGNELHVVWFVRDVGSLFNSDAGNYRVWYSTRTVDSEAIAPVDVPLIPPPQPRTVANERAAPLPTATPRIETVAVENLAEPGELVLAQDITSENDDVLVLLMALGPALAILLATVALVLLRRRWRRA